MYPYKKEAKGVLVDLGVYSKESLLPIYLPEILYLDINRQVLQNVKAHHLVENNCFYVGDQSQEGQETEESNSELVFPTRMPNILPQRAFFLKKLDHQRHFPNQ